MPPKSHPVPTPPVPVPTPPAADPAPAVTSLTPDGVEALTATPPAPRAGIPDATPEALAAIMGTTASAFGPCPACRTAHPPYKHFCPAGFDAVAAMTPGTTVHCVCGNVHPLPYCFSDASTDPTLNPYSHVGRADGAK